jgi:hypothetical protein
MRVLLKSINDSTRDALATMGPQQAERTVRLALVQAKQAGVTIDRTVRLMAVTADYAESQGLDRAIGAEAAIRAIAFVLALGEVGRLDVAAPGRGDKEWNMVMVARLETRAAASPFARQLAILQRFQGSGMGRLQPDSAAAQLLEAANRGDISGMAASFEPRRVQGIVLEGGVPAAMLQALWDDREGNESVIRRRHYDTVARGMQSAELQRAAAQAFAGVIQGQFLARGASQQTGSAAAHEIGRRAAEVGRRAAGARAKEVGRRAADTSAEEDGRRTAAARAKQAGEATAAALFEAGREVTADDARRRDLLVGVLLELGLLPEETAQMAEMGFARFAKEVHERFDMNAQQAFDQFNPKVLKRQRMLGELAALDADMARAFSTRYGTGPMARLIGIIQNPPVDEKTGKVDIAAGVAQCLGRSSGAELTANYPLRARAARLSGRTPRPGSWRWRRVRSRPSNRTERPVPPLFGHGPTTSGPVPPTPPAPP